MKLNDYPLRTKHAATLASFVIFIAAAVVHMQNAKITLNWGTLALVLLLTLIACNVYHYAREYTYVQQEKRSDEDSNT